MVFAEESPNNKELMNLCEEFTSSINLKGTNNNANIKSYENYIDNRFQINNKKKY